MGIGAHPGNTEFSLDADDGIDMAGQNEWYQKFWGTQAWSYERGGGWIFWTWKCEKISTKEGKEDRTREMTWCYQNAV